MRNNYYHIWLITEETDYFESCYKTVYVSSMTVYQLKLAQAE